MTVFIEYSKWGLHNILLFLTLPLISCSGDNGDRNVYKDGRVFTYGVYFYDNQENIKDSCQIDLIVGKTSLIRLLMPEQTPLRFMHKKCCGQESIKENTGLIDNNERVFIHPPRLGCMAFTALSPMPDVNLPYSTFTSTTGTLTVGKSNYEGLSGKRLKQKTENTGTTTFHFKDQEYEVYMTEGENTNHIDEFGVNKVTHYFNRKLGFVLMIYNRPDGTKVVLLLKDINFELPE